VGLLNATVVRRNDLHPVSNAVRVVVQEVKRFLQFSTLILCEPTSLSDPYSYYLSMYAINQAAQPSLATQHFSVPCSIWAVQILKLRM